MVMFLLGCPFSLNRSYFSLWQQVVVTDDDIKQQETKVTESRRKLEELLAALEKSNREALVRGDRPLSAIPSEVSDLRL